jgi:hypothetical protein
VHAIASPYRERSHFDGQDLLENGAAQVGGLRDGWLNRALADFDSGLGRETAIALAPNTPLVLRGSHSVTSWAPSRLPDADDNTLQRLQSLYADDEFFSTRLQQALRSQEIAAGSANMSNTGRGNEARQFADLMSSAARLTAPWRIGFLRWMPDFASCSKDSATAGEKQPSLWSLNLAEQFMQMEHAAQITVPLQLLCFWVVPLMAAELSLTGPGWAVTTFMPDATCGQLRIFAACLKAFSVSTLGSQTHCLKRRYFRTVQQRARWRI